MRLQLQKMEAELECPIVVEGENNSWLSTKYIKELKRAGLQKSESDWCLGRFDGAIIVDGGPSIAELFRPLGLKGDEKLCKKLNGKRIANQQQSRLTRALRSSRAIINIKRTKGS